MIIKLMKTSDLVPASYNPRKVLNPKDLEYQKLDDSIKEFGLVEPLIWNEKTGNLVGGHQRLTVLLDNHVEEVEVSVVNLTLDKEKLLNLALNRIQGDWDDEKLRELLKDLGQIPDINLGLSGFDGDEILKLLDSMAIDLTDSEDVVLNEVQESAITQKGDVIELGRHKLMCGDAASPEDLKVLMGDQQAVLLHTDPPYNCVYDPSARPFGNQSKRASEKLQNDDLDQPAYEVWLESILKNMRPFLGEGSPFYIWNGHRQFSPMHGMLTRLDAHISNVITWVKPNVSPSFADYQMQSEFCLYGWFSSSQAHRWYGNSDETNVWELPRDSQSQIVHPTQKPQLLVQRALKNSTRRGDLVLDLFGGSGSTLIASEKIGRVCYCMEIDPRYCDIIVKRYISKFGATSVSDAIRQKYLA